MRRYFRTQFQLGAPRATFRLVVLPGSQAQVDLGYTGPMIDPILIAIGVPG
jgi:hypothetical protein